MFLYFGVVTSNSGKKFLIRSLIFYEDDIVGDYQENK